MAVTGKLFGKVFVAAFSKGIDWLNDSIKVSLHTASYTPDQDAQAFKSDLTNEIAAGGGYSTGGLALTGKTLTYTAATNKINLGASNAVWPSSTITARTAVVYDDTPALATQKPLVVYQQSDVDISSSGADFTIAWASNGLAEITVA